MDRVLAAGGPRLRLLGRLPGGEVTAVVQELVRGRAVGDPDPGLVLALLALNAVQRGALEVAGGSPADLHLEGDGPGFCLHEPLRRHSRASRALLDRVHEVGRGTPPDVFHGDDAVHLDFHPGNVLTVPGSTDRVAGVVDWTGARAGDCGLDLVTLGFALDHDGAPPAARAEVLERIRAEVDPEARRAFAAHMALRQVDWAIRHHGPAAAESWLAVATRWLDRAG